MSQERAETYLRDFRHLCGKRTTWESHWEEIAGRVFPAYSGLFTADGEGRTPGEKRAQQMVDSTAAIARGRFAAVMESMLTPRNTKWHRLVAADPALAKDRNVRLWLEEATRLLFKYRYAPKANFSSQNHQNYESLGAFGTGSMFIDDLADEPGLRYRAVHLGEVFFAENHQGIIDKVYRRFRMTARQAAQKWGAAKLPEKIRNALSGNKLEQEFAFLHCVRPRENRDVERRDYRGMAFESCYVAIDDKAILQEGGYNTFPYAISRYTQAPGEVYGRSPAMDALPSIKTLNEQKRTMLKQGHRSVDPVLLAHDDGVLDAFSLKPGAINYGAMTADGRPLVATLPVGNVAIGKELMDDERAIINDAFLVTLFQILVETPQMTATEVLERVREKGVLLSPTMGRQQSEYLGPMVDRELDGLARQNLLPPMPPSLVEAGGEYNTEYDSPLSRAQRAEEASGVMRTIESALNVVNVTQNPEPLDHFDWDVIIPEIAEIQAVPAHWMRSLDDVQRIREGRAQQAEEAKAIEAAPAAAAVMKTMQQPQARA